MHHNVSVSSIAEKLVVFLKYFFGQSGSKLRSCTSLKLSLIVNIRKINRTMVNRAILNYTGQMFVGARADFIEEAITSVGGPKIRREKKALK